MRRIKVHETGAYYHAMSQTVNGEVFLNRKAKEVLRRGFWRAACNNYFRHNYFQLFYAIRLK